MVYWIHGDLQEVVPMVLWLDDGENGIYGEAISYAFRRGRITFYYNRDDLEYPDNLPGDLTFRVVVFE